MTHGADGTARPDPEPLSQAVVETVADREDVAPTELERPLHDVIDPEALNGLFDRTATSGYVVFQYYGYRIQVSSDGDVWLTDQSR